MALFQITRFGLATTATVVMILWGCLLAERAILREARIEHYRAMRDLRYLKIRRMLEPASAPVTAPASLKAPRTLG